MYEYLTKRHLESLGDQYLPASPTRTKTPWAIADTVVQGISVRCYQNAPREQILTRQVPYTMEISYPGGNFVCIGNPTTAFLTCPESVHQNADPKDPWRIRQCAAWKEALPQQMADLVATEDFRKQVTDNILNVAGISAFGKLFAKPAEFVQVVEERERREGAIKVVSILALAAGGGVILWKYLKRRKLQKEQEIQE